MPAPSSDLPFQSGKEEQKSWIEYHGFVEPLIHRSEQGVGVVKRGTDG